MPRTASKANRRKEQDTNPFTRLPYTGKYKKLLRKRKELPAFARMDEFYKVVRTMRTVSIWPGSRTGRVNLVQ
jgi:hypothetical protein